MATRTPQEGAEQARAVGREIADLVHSKQLAYGDASGVQHEIWKVLLEQYEASGLDLIGSHLYQRYPNGEDVYVIPRALMDHIPRLTRVFDRICRIVSNPAQDRMGEDPWRDLAGDAICGVVMPRTTPPLRGKSLDYVVTDDVTPTVQVTISTEKTDWCFEGRIREAGSERYLTDEEVKEKVGVGGVVFERARRAPLASGVGPSGMAGFMASDESHERVIRNAAPREHTDLGELLAENERMVYGDDPIENAAISPRPADTRFWNEEMLGTVRVPKNPLSTAMDSSELSLRGEYYERARARKEADERLAERLEEKARRLR